MIIKMEMKNTSDNGPAWKQPWFLFVMGLPAIVVVACFVTLFYAIFDLIPTGDPVPQQNFNFLVPVKSSKDVNESIQAMSF